MLRRSSSPLGFGLRLLPRQHTTRIDGIVDEFFDYLGKGVTVRHSVVVVVVVIIVSVMGVSRRGMVPQVVANIVSRGLATKAAQRGVGSKGTKRHG